MGKSWKEKPDKWRRQLEKKNKKQKKGPKPHPNQDDEEYLWKPGPMGY